MFLFLSDHIGWIKIGSIALCIIAVLLAVCSGFFVIECFRKWTKKRDFSVTLEHFRQHHDVDVPQFNMEEFNNLHDRLPTPTPERDVVAAGVNPLVTYRKGNDDDDDDDGEIVLFSRQESPC